MKQPTQQDLAELGLPTLPGRALQICAELEGPPRLIAHLTLVHAVAVELVARITDNWPALNIDRDLVELGAALHDIGKAEASAELEGPGSEHETAGEESLLAHGLRPEVARMARTHADWTATDAQLEDALVALADKCWKGKRHEELETHVAKLVAGAVGIEVWEAFSALDEIVGGIAEGADERLDWQGRFSVE